MSEDYLTVIEDIPVGSVFAYRKGDRIERAAVEANDWHDYVATSTTKTARTAVAEATGTTKEK